MSNVISFPWLNDNMDVVTCTLRIEVTPFGNPFGHLVFGEVVKVTQSQLESWGLETLTIKAIQSLIRKTEWATPLLDWKGDLTQLQEILNEISILFQGDTTALPKYYPYSTNVLALAKSHKTEQLKEEELMLGVELEFSHSEYSLKELSPLLQMGVFKYDGSVDGEYVTLPYIPEEMLGKVQALGPVFDKLLSSNGWEGNGMHVHVSRAALTMQQILNIQAVLNNPEAHYMWELIAGRNLRDNQYCKHTVEFRMFRAPSTVEGVIKNLQVILGLLEFCKDSRNPEEWASSKLNPWA